jgi:hypothetical protein
MELINRFINALIIVLLLIFPVYLANPANAQPEALPDLAIVDDLVFSSPRVIGQPIDVTVIVRNLGNPNLESDAQATTITLTWCCGTATKPLDPMAAGEYREVKFENMLTFPYSGRFSIEAKIDPDTMVIEIDESNNNRSNVIEIGLTSAGYSAESTVWSGETTQHSCPDVDLMQIGRKYHPVDGIDIDGYIMEDSDGDGILDRLIREPNGCFFKYTDPESPDYTPGISFCDVYKTGQRVTACGTTSLAYTLQYFQINVFPDEIDDEIRFHNEQVNEGRMFSDPLSLRDYARSRGMNAEIYINGTVENIKSYTDRGIPVLLNISADAGETSVFRGHWVVALSVCQDEAASIGGIPRTTIVLYDPNGRQFGITPSHLYDYWDSLYIEHQKLWTHLYIPITFSYLESGNTDEITGNLVIARAIALAGVGYQDWSEFSLGEGLVETAGGAVSALIAYIGLAFQNGAEVPGLGGIFSATGEYIADVAYSVSEITQGAADLLNWETWTDIEKLGEALWDIVKGVGLLIYETLEYVFDLVVDGIWGLLKDIGSWFVDIGCDWFGVGCKQTVVHHKHNASRDPCMECLAFLNNYARSQQIGYIFTEPVPDTIPLYLYADPFLGPGRTFLSDTFRKYYLCTRTDWADDDPKLLYLGLFGYSSSVDPGGYINLSTILDSNGLKLPDRSDSVVCDPNDAYGFILPTPYEKTSPLYVMEPLNLVVAAYHNFPLSLDPCFDTQTFFNQYAEGYTRETLIGKILLSPIDGTVPLYRAFRTGVIDFMFYTDQEKKLPGFEEQGILGYIFSDQVEGTVPLYQFYYQGRDDHLLTLHPFAEGLPGYKDQEILGYIFPPETEEPSCCLADLWRFCKRREIQE